VSVGSTPLNVDDRRKLIGARVVRAGVDIDITVRLEVSTDNSFAPEAG